MVRCHLALPFRGAWFKLSLLTVLSFIAFYLFVCILFFEEQENRLLSEVKFRTLIKERLRQPVFRGNYCWEKVCHTVWDVMGHDSLPIESSDYVHRALRVEGMDGFVSVIRLQFPKVSLMSNLDTSTWKVDKKFIPSLTPVFPFISSMFTSTAIKLTESPKGRVLLIGLGGGNVPSTIPALFPEISLTTVDINPSMRDVALEQFQVEETLKNKIVIEDGVKYIKQEWKNNIVYDALILDACGAGKDNGAICPLSIFRTPEVLGHVKQLLSERGVFIVNIIFNEYSSVEQNKRQLEILEEVTRIFGKNKCVLKPVHQLMNGILVCRQAGLPNETEWKRIEHRFAERVGFKLE